MIITYTLWGGKFYAVYLLLPLHITLPLIVVTSTDGTTSTRIQT